MSTSSGRRVPSVAAIEPARLARASSSDWRAPLRMRVVTMPSSPSAIWAVAVSRMTLLDSNPGSRSPAHTDVSQRTCRRVRFFDRLGEGPPKPAARAPDGGAGNRASIAYLAEVCFLLRRRDMSAATSRQLAGPEPLAGERSQPLTVSVRKVRIEVVQGPDRGAQLELGDKPLLVGRAPVCGLVLTDASVGWLHAELALVLGGVQIRNLGSRNGVQVGAALVDDARVAPGASVLVGRSVLALHAT